MQLRSLPRPRDLLSLLLLASLSLSSSPRVFSSPVAPPLDPSVSILLSLTASTGVLDLWDFDASTPLSTLCADPPSTRITCDASHTTVVEIDLGEHEPLRGVELRTLAGLAELGGLEVLKLNGNNLVGSLPPEFSKLVNLKTLDLSSNSLSGSLPSSWAGLEKLEVLNLYSNNLEGLLPPEFSALVNLKILDLDSNYLSGSLPLSWSGLQKLEYLVLYSNNLEGPLPPDFSALVNLKYLDLNTNSLSGTLPSSWSGLQKLDTLRLYSNRLEGSLPPEFSALVNLKTLDLDSNSLSGTLPSSWASMEKMEGMYLYLNKLEGSLPPEFSTLVNLKYLYLNSNSFTGTLPTSWKGMTELRELLLHENQLEGSLPSDFASLINVNTVTLNSNFLSGTLPSSWKSLVQLANLNLADNNIEGVIPSEWGSMQNLQIVDLSSNNLEGEIPLAFSDLTSLQVFRLSSNFISGGIERLFPIATLTELLVSDNLLSGSLSFVKHAGDGLVILNLSGNEFDPAVSPASFVLASVDRKKRLLVVDVSGVHFTCPFPATSEASTSNAFSVVMVIHDKCASNYASFLLNYCPPFLGGMIGIFLLWKLASSSQHSLARQISYPMKKVGVHFTVVSHKRLKVFRLILFSFMIYDNVNDVVVYKKMLDVVNNEVFDDPCRVVNDRDLFYPAHVKFPFWNYNNGTYDNATYYPDFICEDEVVGTNCRESEFTTFTQYLYYLDLWVANDWDEGRDANVNMFAAFCADFYVVDGTIHECSFSNATTTSWVKDVLSSTGDCDRVEGVEGCRIEAPAGCVRVRNVQRERNLSYKPYILMSIAVFALKEIAKVLLVIFVWLRASKRELRPLELSLVGESPFLLILAWRRPGFLRELLLTPRTWKSHLAVFVIEDILESVNQVTLVVFFALNVSQKGIEFGIMFSLAASVLKLLKSGYNVLSAWVHRTDERSTAKVQDDGDGGRGE